MSDSQKTEPTAQMAVPTTVRKRKTEQEKIEARLRYAASLKAPATPLMLSSKQAWKRLCAKTGCGITFGAFQGWIRDGKIPVVRLGGKIFVPITIMEHVITQCLAGHPLI
ncbi:MAG TPA: hypothetical protein VKV95_13455 [Terriglobia bacterium]|nr:hypothetical protein [Terriglobia bacterium]